MGSKSRPFYGMGVCARECANEGPKCNECLNFSEWKLPGICSLYTIALWVEKQEDWVALGRIKYVIQGKGDCAKVNRDDMLEVLGD